MTPKICHQEPPNFALGSVEDPISASAEGASRGGTRMDRDKITPSILFIVPQRGVP